MKLQGALDFASVQRLLAEALPLPADGVLDLSAVERIDSAGLSLLLELSRRATAKGIKLRLADIRPQPLALAHFFGVDGLLDFSGGSSGTRAA